MNTTLHEISTEEIMAHHDGELAADRAIEVAAHLESCSECIVFADRLRSTSSVLESWRVDSSTSLQPPDTASSSLPIQYSWQLLLNRRVILGLVALLSTISFVFFEVTRTYQSAVRTTDLQEATRVDINNYVPHEGRAAGGGGGGGHLVDRAWINSAPHPQSSTRNLPLHVPRAGLTVPESAPQIIARQVFVSDTPLIARVFELQIVAKSFEDTRSAVQAILLRRQGYTANLNISDTDTTPRTLTTSLRVPEQQAAEALSELEALGHVTNETQTGEEVTAEHADLVARLKNSRETEIRLQDILRNRTGKVSDILEVEQEIARVRGEIEQMDSELKNLNHRVDFATINLTIHEEYKAKVSGSTPAIGIRLHNATVAGFQSAASSALGMILWLIEIMPSLLLWAAMLGFPAWWLWRRTQRAFTSAI